MARGMIAGMSRRNAWLLLAVALLAAWIWWPLPSNDASPAPASAPVSVPAASPDARPDAAIATIPREAFDTLRLIEQGGPFPYRQDGGRFGNRERLLPLRDRGWYREYTVRTPGARDRGARRIVTGGGSPGERTPSEFFYTADHYRSFRRFDPRTGRLQDGRLR